MILEPPVMCCDITLFSTIYDLKKPHPVILPNGSFFIVLKVGTIALNSSIRLQDVFYIPAFKFNLLLVHQLTTQHKLKFIFSPNGFQLQDLDTE